MNTGSKIGVTAVFATTLVAAVVIGGIGIGGLYLADDPPVAGQSAVTTDLGMDDSEPTEATVQVEEVDGTVTQLYPKETIELDTSEQLKLTTALKTVGVDVDTNTDTEQLDTTHPNSIWTTVTVTVDGEEVNPEAYRPTGEETIVVTVESTPQNQYH